MTGLQDLSATQQGSKPQRDSTRLGPLTAQLHNLLSDQLHQPEQALSWFGGTGRLWENSRLQMPWMLVHYKSTNDQNG